MYQAGRMYGLASRTNLTSSGNKVKRKESNIDRKSGWKETRNGWVGNSGKNQEKWVELDQGT